MPAKTILVSLDLDDLAAVVLDDAVELAARLEARLHVVHAVTPPVIDVEVPSALVQASIDQVIAHERELLDPVVRGHRDAGRLSSVVTETGEPVDVILATADKLGADLIVVGTHGRRGISRLMLGSVAEQVARRALCPVMLIRERPAR